jgi:hypothetical protein
MAALLPATCPRRRRVSDSEAALDWPALEGYTIGSGEDSPEEMTCRDWHPG